MLQAYGAQRLRFACRIYLAWVANGAILPSNVLGLDWIEQSSIWDRSGTRCFHTWLVGRWSQGLGDRKALQLFLNICKVKGQGLKRCKVTWTKVGVNELSAKVLDYLFKFIFRTQWMAVTIIHLYASVGLLGAQLTNALEPVIGAVLRGEICTVLQERFEFLALVIFAISLDDFMQVMESCD